MTRYFDEKARILFEVKQGTKIDTISDNPLQRVNEDAEPILRRYNAQAHIQQGCFSMFFSSKYNSVVHASNLDLTHKVNSDLTPIETVIKV
jgi:hypothetical protein